MRYKPLRKFNLRDALDRLRTSDSRANVDAEFEQMVGERDTSVKAAAIDDDRVGVRELLLSSSSRRLRLPLLVCIAAHLSQQLSGMVAIFYYSTGFFEASGVAREDAAYSTLGVGAIMVAMTVVTIPLMDRAGRRTLHLIGLAGKVRG